MFMPSLVFVETEKLFEAMGYVYRSRLNQESRLSLIEEQIQRDIKKRELDELRKQYIQEEG